MTAYLDHSASTPTRPEVVEAMVAHLRQRWANPSGAHRLARQARQDIDDARDVVAELVGAEPGEVVFTSGGTESDNLAVLGTLDAAGGVAVCSAVEHHAVADPVASRHGVTVGVDAGGRIDLAALETTLDELAGAGRPVSLVSVMLVNNEVGTIQPLDRVVEVVRAHAPGAVVHTDAVQAPTWLDVAWAASGADLVSISAHKFGGPKGVGALVVRGAAHPAARQLGGGQERGRRSGTPDVAGIVGLGVAARLALDDRDEVVERVGKLRDRLAAGLRASVPDLVLTGEAADATADGSRVAGICHVCVPGVENEALVYLLEQRDLYASAGASCASGGLEPSPVLAAMGVPRDLARGSLRLSLGWPSTDAEVDAALEAVPAAVERLRRFPAPDLAEDRS